MKTPLISIGSEITEHIYNQNESFYTNPVIFKLIDSLIIYDDLETISSFHPLGFIHINIPSVSNISNIRLHIWPDDIIVNKTPIDIHDHYYDIKSYVICGKIQNIIYKVIDDIDGKFYIYYGKYNSDKSKRTLIKSDTPVSVLTQSSEIVSAGNYYFIDRDSFHNSVVNDFTSTIVLINNYKLTSEPKVIGLKNGSEILEFPKHYIDKNVIIKNLVKIKNEISIHKK